MKFTIKAFALTMLLVGLAAIGNAQTALTQTTLSAAVGGGVGYSGLTSGLDTSVTLASVTSVVAPVNGSIQTYLYVDREAMAVTAVNTTTKVASVARGVLGTQANPHASGAMVLLGANNFFLNYDPSGACTAANTISTPWVNVLNGQQWLCSSVTGDWIPGFGNAGGSGSAVQVSAAVASAAGQITPSGPLFHITGTLAITGFLIPVGFDATGAGGGSFCIIPDGAFTTTTANNIAIASTAVVNKQLCYVWDATNSKFVPSY